MLGPIIESSSPNYEQRRQRLYLFDKSEAINEITKNAITFLMSFVVHRDSALKAVTSFFELFEFY
jgi:hypothetical protein